MDLIATYHHIIVEEYKLKNKVFDLKQSTPLSSSPGTLGPTGTNPDGLSKNPKSKVDTFEKKITGIIDTGSPTCPFDTHASTCLSLMLGQNNLHIIHTTSKTRVLI